jgi:hypothetical protein
MALSPRLAPLDKLGRIQLEEILKTLRPFALAADRVESALGSQALDTRPVRRGAMLTLSDLRRARAMFMGLKRTLEARRGHPR